MKAAVVIPVHDEAKRLGACLEGIARAVKEVPALVVVVLDHCHDESERIARASAAGPEVVVVSSRNVGAARAAGMKRALERIGDDVAWLATTDADSVVPPTWLAQQIALAERGAAAVAGSIEVQDWSEQSAAAAARFEVAYDAGGPHVHGANLGVRSDAYLAVGGFPPLETGEDHALWNALGRAGYARVWSPELVVVTSARRRARAPHGFSTYLEDLEPASVRESSA